MGSERPSLGVVIVVVVLGLITAGGLCAQKKKEHTTAVAVGDLNGDGKPDVVFANRGQANQVFLNNGEGNFRDLVPDVLAKAAGDSTCVVLVDVDGDLDPDIVFGNDNAEMRLILNDGKAGFTDASAALPLLKEPHTRAIAAGDVDKDGDLDLVIASFGKQNLLLLNDGKGTFTRAPDKAWPRDSDYTHCVAVGDIDLDGDLDVLFGNHKDPKGRGGDNTLLLNDGKGSFIPGSLPKDRTSTSVLLLADMDGDRFPEILQGILSERGGRTKQLGNEVGTFRNRTYSHMPRALLHVSNAVVADLDGDGDLDMVVTVRDAACQLWENDGAGKLSDTTKGRLPEGIHPTTALAAADVDGDGDLDLILANDGEANLLLRNQGTGRFADDVEKVSFLNKVEAANHARLRAIEKKHGFKFVKQDAVGKGRYRLRMEGRTTLDDATAAAIQLGLTWLAKHQDKNGGWDSDGFAKQDPKDKPCDGKGRMQYDLPITSLALLPFLADANTPFTGEYHELVGKGVDWIRQTQQKNGRIEDRGLILKEYIYGQCMATMVLCESYGLTGEPTLRKSAQSAINYLAEHHTRMGGWGYDKGQTYCDMSITAWAIQAYQAAQDFGFEGRAENLMDAQKWIHARTDVVGRCGYAKKGETSSRHPGVHIDQFPPELGEAMTAAALLCRYFLGETPTASQRLKLGVKLLLKKPPKWSENTTDLYYWYFGSQAMHQHGGEQELAWREALLKALLPNQRQDGSFAGSFDPCGVWGQDGGRVYATALALLCLQAPYRYERVVEPKHNSTDK